MIKIIQRLFSKELLAGLLVFNSMAGCGGGENVANSSSSGEGGTSGTGVFAASVSKGTISGFGDLSTGGISYNTNNATISFNGQPGLETQLETGMVVEIDAEVDAISRTGAAESIVFLYKIAGTVDEINIVTRTIVVLEQKILFDEFTTFKNISAKDLSVGDMVLISGFTDANEKILATYIEKPLTAFPNAILEGKLTLIDTHNTTLKIGAQLIDYSDAQLIDYPGAQSLNIENNILQIGAVVRINGSENEPAQGLTNTVLSATTVEGITGIMIGNPGQDTRIEGVITQVAGSSSAFAINNDFITTNSSTVYTNGLASNIVINSRVLVTGTLDSSGIINAELVRFIIPSEISIEAKVDSVDVVNNIISLFGKTIIFDSFTILLDNSNANIQEFSLSNIAIGDRIKISGQNNGQNINAARIERMENISNNVSGILEGVVEDTISSPRFSVSGLTIDTSDLQDLIGFSQRGVTPVTSSAFFASLQPKMIARISGEFLAGILTPSHVEIAHCCNWEVYDSFGNFVGGGNDVVFTWDGTLNTDVLSNNVNATLSTNATIVGGTSVSQDVRIFGPGDYIFDTGLDPSLTTNFGTTNLGGTPLRLTVEPGQMGAHGLFHFGLGGASTVCGKPTCNIDVVLLWDINAVYVGSESDDSNLGAKGQVFNLATVDGNGDGVPGIPVVDGPFVGFNSAYNLNITAP